jgi:hypothetical protein
MEERKPSEVRVSDPLSKVTRTERRSLLGISMIGITLVKTGLVPSKIAALGIEFTQTDQTSLLWIIALVTCYFLIAFTIYAASDFVTWRIAFLSSMKTIRSNIKAWKEEADLKDEHLEAAVIYSKNAKPKSSDRIIFQLSGPLSIMRALFEFLLPIMVGLYAIYILLRN